MRRELFYWTAILLTFALGTAAGDLGLPGVMVVEVDIGLVPYHTFWAKPGPKLSSP
jgi:uncharacterized membrane-anchored protein